MEGGPVSQPVDATECKIKRNHFEIFSDVENAADG